MLRQGKGRLKEAVLPARSSRCWPGVQGAPRVWAQDTELCLTLGGWI